VDLSKLNRSDRIIVVGGLVLFIASFFPWFSVKVHGAVVPGIGTTAATGNGWDVGFLWAGLPALLGLAAAAIILATKLGTATLPQLPVTWGQAFLGAGALSALLVVLKLLIGEDGGGSIGTVRISVDRSWGLFLATLAALAFAGGGYLKFAEENAAGASSA
jgi:hypothetical protein